VYKAILCVIALWWATPIRAYSVLTHEAIIDSSWEQNIRPLLIHRYPQATKDELLEAHAYAYAGCILQDMGYYPFGSKFFSDLVHYVRSGDFVMNLLREAEDLDEYAFALGALAHYAADINGHSIAVNRSVPIEYPKLRGKFGPVVTYGEDKNSHLRVEFGFDVLQVARGNYAPKAYHDFIGFEVAKPVLERAFRDTYSMELKDVFGDLDLALGTYRKTVSSIIPTMTRAAWKMKKDELQKTGVTRKKFVYNLSRASYHKEWDGNYKKPGALSTVLAFVIRVLPKVGPLAALSFKPPTPQTDKLFQDSFDRTLDQYRALLKQQEQQQLRLVNFDFDTGKETRPAEYNLADKTYAELAQKLAGRDPNTVDPALRQNVLTFYKDLDVPFANKRNEKDWKKTLEAINKLKLQGTVATQ
jgi:hypothetical protein